MTTGLKSNRKKAVIFMNLMALFQFAYYTLMKMGVTQHNIDPLDICLTRTFFVVICSFFIALCTKASLQIKSEDRCMLFARSVTGTAGFTLMTFGVPMIPLTS